MKRTALLLLALAGALLADGDAVTAAPPEVVRLNEEGIAHLLENRTRQAVEAFEAAYGRMEKNRILRRNLAAGLAALAEEERAAGKPAEAVRRLDRAIQLHPERLRYRVLRGRARYEATEGPYRLFAKEDFAWVLERDPDHLDALVNLGHIHYLERRLAAAVELWRHALALRPRDLRIRARLLKAERELDVEGAYEVLEATRFVVRYSPSISRELAQAVLSLCETAYNELTARFQHYPEVRTAVTLYAPDEFRSATRVHPWVAGLSDGTIRLTVQPNERAAALRPTIYHEYTHHLIRSIAPRAPQWLHEGLAQMAEKRSRAAAEARLRRAGAVRLADLSDRILSQRDPERVTLLYDLALSFTHHLHDLSGDAGIYSLLERLAEGQDEGPALEHVYGRSREALFDEWRHLLRAR